MKLSRSDAEIFVPDGRAIDEALARVTHLGVCAHQDDLEIMAYHGIIECFGRKDKAFAGITVTDGRGSARNGLYENVNDDEMVQIRRKEQKKAAIIGEYAVQFLLNHPSAAVKKAEEETVAKDLDAIFASCRPKVVYTHNLADKHDTHVAVALRVLAALRRLPAERRPKKVIGCEVWRNLDWLVDTDKVVMDVDRHPNLAESLMGVFDSQIMGGKRYDEAARGRRLANATFFESHAVDKSKALIFGMDLTPLVSNPGVSPAAYVREHVERFRADVEARIEKLS